MASPGRLGILVGGGPAPGINSVIAAATIRARLAGVDVIGIRDGFERLMRGDTTHVTPLPIEAVSRIHFRGGSFLGTSRANPTTGGAPLDAVVKSLAALGIDRLVTIGGDDTAFSAMTVEREAGGALAVAHVPKTIDNDLDLPAHIDTFGFQTARHYGVDIVQKLMVDARTTSRWYFVVAMGRKAGHLALGIGKAAGATLTLIAEEFTAPTPLQTVVDTLAGAIVKRLAGGRRDGVAVLAEGLALTIAPGDLSGIESAAHDAHGHLRIDEVPLAEILRHAVTARLAAMGVTTTITAKNVGYELRSADPIPFDMEYTRDLGYCAATFLVSGGRSAMMSMQGGRFVPIPFADLIDPATGRTRVRLVDIASTRYAIARRYMLRLRQEDFTDAAALASLAAVTSLTPDAFATQFSYLAGDGAI